MEDGARKWEDMEMDCLANIFSRLGVDDLSVSVPFVCHWWSAAAARHTLCWKILDFRSLDFMPWSCFAKRFSTQFHPLPRFSFSGFMNLAARRSGGMVAELCLPHIASVEDLILASNECPRLRKLSLPKLTSSDEPRIPCLMAKWKELEELEMESKPSNFPQLAAEIAQNCKLFNELKMPNSSINREDASAIVAYLPKLRSLDISGSYLPKEQLLYIVEGCRELQRLKAKSCVGFEADDEEVKRKACRIRIFEHEGSKMVVDDFGYEMDECGDLYVHVI